MTRIDEYLDNYRPCHVILQRTLSIADTLRDVADADDALDRIEYIVEADERICELAEMLEGVGDMPGASEYLNALKEATDLLDDGRHVELAEGLVATCERIFEAGLREEREAVERIGYVADAQSW